MMNAIEQKKAVDSLQKFYHNKAKEPAGGRFYRVRHAHKGINGAFIDTVWLRLSEIRDFLKENKGAKLSPLTVM